MTDTKLKQIVRLWWNNASADARRWSIYYSQYDIDEYSWVFFVEHFLKLPGFNAEDYTDEQGDFCKHVCCDILKDLTAPLFAKSL